MKMVAPSLCTSQELITASLAVWGQELMSFPFSIHPDAGLQAVSSQAGQGQGSVHPSESRTLRMGSGQGPLLQVGLWVCAGVVISVWVHQRLAGRHRSSSRGIHYVLIVAVWPRGRTGR